MNTKLFLPLLLAIAFIGATSCGDNTDSSKDAELAALRAKLASTTAVTAGTTVTQSAVATVTVNQTLTNTSIATASAVQ